MPKFEHGVIEQVQQANSIIEVVSEYVSLARKGKEMVGICPFHEDRRPSMCVNDGKQIFKCFACGAGGDVIKFIQMRENLSFRQAIERLADRAGIQVAMSPQPRSSASRASGEGDPTQLARVNKWAERLFQVCLQDPEGGRVVRDYLADRHLNQKSIETWGLGYGSGDNRTLGRAARKQNIPHELLIQAGLLTASGQDRFVNRVIFPIRDASNRVIGFGGRTLSQDSAKYVNSPTTALFDKSNSLYGLDVARPHIVKQDTAIIVEGYTDCIMAHQVGVQNVVATLGTSFAMGHSRMLRRYAKTVILLFDGDKAGVEATNRALDVCLKYGIDIRIATLPSGVDPCDLVQQQGGEAFRQVVTEAIDVLTFKWARLSERFAADQSLAGRRTALEDFLQTIAASIYAGQVSRIDRGLIINRLSSVLGLDTREIDSELNQRIVSLQRTAARQAVPVESTGPSLGHGFKAATERELLEVLLNDPAAYGRLTGLVTLDFFDTPVLKQVAKLVFSMCHENPKVTVAEIMARVEEVELAQCLATLAHEGQLKGNLETRLDALIEVLKRSNEKPNNFGMAD